MRFRKKQPVWSILDKHIKKLQIIEYKHEKSRDEFDYKVEDFESGENAVWVPSYCLRPWSSNCQPGRQITDREAAVTRAEREEEEVRADKEEKKREHDEEKKWEDEEEKKREDTSLVGSHSMRHKNLIDM